MIGLDEKHAINKFMIKPIEISPLNISSQLEYKCENCGDFSIITLTNRVINTNNAGEPVEPLDDYECPKCRKKL